MANTNYHPNRLLFRPDSAGKTTLWNSTDSEYHYNKNKSKIDSHYSANNVTYTYNDLGYRSINFDKLEKDFVLCFGCSYTEGVGVTDSETWPAMLENRVETQCINLGQGGTGMHFQLINATQWLKCKMPVPKAVVLQIPEVTRSPNAYVRYNQYFQYEEAKRKGTLEEDNYPAEYSSIFINGTTTSHEPGDTTDRNLHDKWKQYRNAFPAVIDHTPGELNYHQNQDITPWFMTSQLATVFQTMWNAAGVPVLQMTYDDDGDIIYNPANVFRITGEFKKDYGRDLCHEGHLTHRALTEALAPGVKDMFDWDGVSRQRWDITRAPHDLTHKTMNEAMANLSRFDKKKGGPFIYE